MKTTKPSRRAMLRLGAAATLVPGSLWAQASQRDVEGGIGGTGIVGMLTDFGSLIVAGARVQTDFRTQVRDGFGRLALADLSIGDSLTIEASGPADSLLARRVHLTHPVVGRITQRLAGGRRLTVNGVEVLLDTPARGFDVGERVAVSGLWRGAFVEAARIASARSSLDLVSGDVFGRGRSKRIGAVAVSGPGVRGLKTGSFATALGQYDDATGIMQVQEVQRDRFFGSAGPLKRLAIEGYLDPTRQAPGFRVSGLGHSFERNLVLEDLAARRVLLTGPYTGLFDAKQATLLPDTFAQQRRVLRAISRQAG